MSRTLILGLSLYWFAPVIAQINQIGDWGDTLTPHDVAFRKFVTLDSIRGDTVYSLTSPKGYVIRSYVENTIYLALKTKKGYKVFDACPDVTADYYDFETIDFDGRGNKELLINWSNIFGRGGLHDGYTENTSGIFLWNLDDAQLIFSMQDGYDFDFWWYERPLDSLGNEIDTIIGGGIQRSCENYRVDIQFRKIVIQGEPNCYLIDDESGEEIPIDTTTYFFEFEEGALIRKYVHAALPEGLEDTILMYYPPCSIYKTLDSIPGDTVFTLTSPKGYVIESHSNSGSTIFVALKVRSGYQVFDITPDASLPPELTFSTINFDGRGDDELMIKWTAGTGVSSWWGGWSEQSGGIAIWDLNKMRMMFNFQNYYSYNSWSNSYEYDSLGNVIINDDDSSYHGESSCENYDVDVSLRKITIQRSSDCPYVEQETGLALPVDSRTYVYELRPCGLVLKK